MTRHLVKRLWTIKSFLYCPRITEVLRSRMAKDVKNLLQLNYGEDQNKEGFGRHPDTVPLPEVLHHCSNYIIIDKPFDVSINSFDPSKFTVETLLCRLFPEKIDHTVANSFRFVHQLDNATSGVLIVALNKKAAAKMSTVFCNRKVSKHYLALVRGHVLEKKMLIQVPIGYDTTQEEGVHKMCVKGSPGCVNEKSCVTKMITLEHGLYDSDPATKVLLLPITGRTHQLRVHCKHIGHRIVGDYGYSNRTDTEPYRMMLHAHRLNTQISNQSFDITAQDVFIPSVDPKWQPSEIVTTYSDVISSDNLNSDSYVKFKDVEPQSDLSNQFIREVIR